MPEKLALAEKPDKQDPFLDAMVPLIQDESFANDFSRQNPRRRVRRARLDATERQH